MADSGSSHGLMPSYPDTCNECHNSIQSKPWMPLIHNINAHTDKDAALSF